MKKILIVSINNNLGGAEHYLKMVAENYKNEKVDLVFFRKTIDNEFLELKKYKNFTLLFFNKFSEHLGALLFIIYCLFRRTESYDYVFTSHVLVTSIVGILFKFNRIKSKSFIGRESTTVFSRFKGLKLYLYKRLYNLGYKSLTLLICQTDGMRTNLIENLNWLENFTDVKTLPNPVDLDQFNLLSKTDYNPSLKYGDYVVAAGRLINIKGFDILISSFNVLRRSNQNLNLVILGEGDERIKLQKKIRKLNLEKHVFLIGFVNNVYPYFKHAKMGVISSRVEGFPNVLLQMMSQNTKVVCTKCASGIESISGIFISEINNAEKLQKQMNLALISNTEDNRLIFDEYLKNRSIKLFISEVEKYCNN